MISDLLKLYLFIYSWISQTGVSSTNSITTCKGKYAEFKCDSGVIQINYASFGRHDNFTCPHSSMRVTNCHSNNSQSVVEQICQGKQACTIRSDRSTFGNDPCPWIHKYVIINYNCTDPRKGVSATNTIIVCEYTSHKIQCDSGLIQIISASFGRHDNKTCPLLGMLSTNCHASNSQSVVQQICEGKKTCTVFVGLSTFGIDPCVGIYKYLDAEYNCIDPIKNNKINDNYNTGMFKSDTHKPNVQLVGDTITSRKSGSLIERLSRDCSTKENCNSAIFDPLGGIWYTFTSPNGK